MATMISSEASERPKIPRANQSRGLEHGNLVAPANQLAVLFRCPRSHSMVEAPLLPASQMGRPSKKVKIARRKRKRDEDEVIDDADEKTPVSRKRSMCEINR